MLSVTFFIILKNISQDKLNISVEELMQRFVRGDTSRTTEGSGLGISIAKSLYVLSVIIDFYVKILINYERSFIF